MFTVYINELQWREIVKCENLKCKNSF